MPLIGIVASRSGGTPTAPTIGTATAGDSSATVAYTASTYTGKGSATYTAISSPGSLTGTGASPITVSGLTNGTAYTFTVRATSTTGEIANSAASNSVSPVAPQYVAIGGGNTPYLRVYPWSSGFGTKYSDPVGYNAGPQAEVAFKPQGDAIAVVGHGGAAPYMNVYPWSSSGFGSKYSQPATAIAGRGYGVNFRPQGDAIAIAHQTQHKIAAYPWSSSGFGTKYADPTGNPALGGQFDTSGARAVAYSPAGDAIAVGFDTNQKIFAYSWSSGFGTKYADPSNQPGDQVHDVAFKPQGDAIAFAAKRFYGSPAVGAYPWSSGSGFGTRYSNPATEVPNNGFGVAFKAQGDAIAVAHLSSPFVTAYPWSSGFGTKYANPVTAVAGSGYGVDFSRNGDAIAVAHSTTPFVSAYPWSAGFGTKYADPGTIPNGRGNNVDFI